MDKIAASNFIVQENHGLDDAVTAERYKYLVRDHTRHHAAMDFATGPSLTLSLPMHCKTLRESSEADLACRAAVLANSCVYDGAPSSAAAICHGRHS